MLATRRILSALCAVCFMGTVVPRAIAADPASSTDSDSDALVVQTPAGSFRIPRSYLVKQATSQSGHLAFSNATFAFEIQMPDGGEVGHDYGLEGMPDVKADQKSYPVVVNEVSFGHISKNVYSPDRMLGNLVFSSNIAGLNITYWNNMVVLNPAHHVDTWMTQYYTMPFSVGESGRVSALIRCQQSISGNGLPSSCDGWELAEGLGLVMHLRFPRLKLSEYASINEQVLKKIESWKQN